MDDEDEKPYGDPRVFDYLRPDPAWEAMTPWQRTYSIVFGILWAVIFIGGWAASAWLFGWKGAAVGWLPSLVGGYILAWIWPILAVLLVLALAGLALIWMAIP